MMCTDLQVNFWVESSPNFVSSLLLLPYSITSTNAHRVAELLCLKAWPCSVDDMARSWRFRLAALISSNVLLPVAALVFATGFFPYKPFLPGLATFQDVQEQNSKYTEQPEAAFDRVVFMVVDALRSDFVYGYNSGFEFTQR